MTAVGADGGASTMVLVLTVADHDHDHDHDRADDGDGDGRDVVVHVHPVDRATVRRLLSQHPPTHTTHAAPAPTALGDTSPIMWGPGFLPAVAEAAIPGMDADTAGRLLDDPDTADDLTAALLAACEPGSIDPARQRLLTDPALYAEVRYCAKTGIPHSQFRAWPAADRDLVLAYELLRVETCPGCGVPEEDMRGHHSEWEVRQRQCGRCLDLARARDALHRDKRATDVDRASVHTDLIRSPADDEDGEAGP